ncbi:MAG: fimbrial assembly protein [Bdellovibrionaceae bacterium]|nr:fimbrial assembly protein [Pseudobdellovibrionaceae bacterium]
MLFGSKKLLGIDIGTSSVKVAEIDVSRKGMTLQRFEVFPTPTAAVASGEIVESHLIAEVIADVVGNLKIKRKQVAAGLWGSAVIVKRITIPKMDKSLVAEQIRWEAEQYIPFDLNEVNLDYHVINEGRKDSDSMDILLVAAQHEQIFKFIEIVEAAGLNCSLLDVSGFALANTFFHNYGAMEGQVIALLNVGANYTNCAIVENGEVIFCRDIPVGGAIYTSDIQKALGVSFAEAEVHKLSFSRGEPAPEDVASVISSSHEVVCDEILGSFEFFSNTTQGASISQVYVSGGGSLTPGLVETLSKSLQLPIEQMNPFFRVTPSKGVTQEKMKMTQVFASVVVGLASRKVGD